MYGDQFAAAYPDGVSSSLEYDETLDQFITKRGKPLHWCIFFEYLITSKVLKDPPEYMGLLCNNKVSAVSIFYAGCVFN
jgi:hypothetical protein